MSKDSKNGLAVVASAGAELLASSAFFINPNQPAGYQLLNGEPLRYRANCEKSVGKFFLNNTVDEGDSIKMKVLNMKEEPVVYFSDQTGEEPAVSIVFLNDTGVVSNMFLRTHSIGNFKSLINALMAKKVSPITQIITAKMSKKTSNGNTYHIVEFSAEPNTPEDVKDIFEFIQELPEALQAFPDAPQKPEKK